MIVLGITQSPDSQKCPPYGVFAGVGRLLKSHTAHRPSSRASGLEES